MILKLNGLEVSCVIGDLPEERTHEQTLRVDLVLEITDLAAETDELADTIDYAALSEAIRETLQNARCRMIERAAYLVVETCFRFGGSTLLSARAEVVKTGAIAKLESASAIYERTNER